jgi:acylpyruvate hydrolase
MRLVTVRTAAGTLAAVETPDGRRVLNDAEGRSFRDVGDLLRRDPALAARPAERVPTDLPLARPVLDPGAVICVGLNYRKHVLEMGRELPASPTYFTKLARSLADPDADVALPRLSSKVDYEGELAVVIGAGGRDIPRERAWEAVAGLTLLDDVSMRDWQRRSSQFFAGKAWERCSAIGPVVVTLDELPRLGDREIVTRVNGEDRQRAPLSDMIFDVPALVADLSQVFALAAGDVIATGTPHGVGDAMDPPRHLAHGDVVEIELAGIGVLRSRFVRPA